MKTGIELIAAERDRQINDEGWSAKHDDQHEENELAWAACYYAMPCPRALGLGAIVYPLAMYPRTWDRKWCKRLGQYDRVRDLAKAGALIAAEIDRLQRLKARAEVDQLIAATDTK